MSSSLYCTCKLLQRRGIWDVTKEEVCHYLEFSFTFNFLNVSWRFFQILLLFFPTEPGSYLLLANLLHLTYGCSFSYLAYLYLLKSKICSFGTLLLVSYI